MKHTVAADAAFLRHHHDVETAATAGVAGVAQLEQDSLLSLQVDALLEECSLNSNNRLHSKAARYAESVTTLLQAMPAVSNAALNELAAAEGGAPWSSSRKKNKHQEGTTALFSDDDHHPLAEESNRQQHRLSVLQQQSRDNDAVPPLLLRASSNAHVVPTLERTIVLPNSLWEPHDFKRGRYFRVCCVSVALYCFALRCYMCFALRYMFLRVLICVCCVCFCDFCVVFCFVGFLWLFFFANESINQSIKMLAGCVETVALMLLLRFAVALHFVYCWCWCVVWYLCFVLCCVVCVAWFCSFLTLYCYMNPVIACSQNIF